jgi:hypothetical protein
MCRFSPKPVALLLALLLVGCGGKPAALSADRRRPEAFPGADAVPGWTPVGDAETFDSENLYDLVNGQAESFFAYGFEQVAVRHYENAEGTNLDVEVWQLATPADAYGLFTAQRAGTPAIIGNDGDGDPGRRLAFWQDRYVAHVRARQEVDSADLQALAEAVSAALPSGGERPGLMDHLPPDELVARSAIFFHEEISIQGDLWLGGENLLGLSPETDGVLARYDVGGVVAHLLLVQYPDAEAASTGLAALESSQVGGLVTVDARDTLLGAVFGEVDEASGDTLLGQALQ